VLDRPRPVAGLLLDLAGRGVGGRLAGVEQPRGAAPSSTRRARTGAARPSGHARRRRRARRSWGPRQSRVPGAPRPSARRRRPRSIPSPHRRSGQPPLPKAAAARATSPPAGTRTRQGWSTPSASASPSQALRAARNGSAGSSTRTAAGSCGGDSARRTHAVAAWVVDQPSVGAVNLAAPQLGIQRVQGVGVQRAGLLPPDERPDVLLQVARVARCVVGPTSRVSKIAVEQLIDCRAGAGVASFVDLRQEPGPGRFGQRQRLRTGRNHLDGSCLLPLTGSLPAYTRTHSTPLRSSSIVPRARRRAGRLPAMTRA
jgi:hypothetical protein